LSQSKCIFDADNADLFAIGANKTDFRDADSVIGTGIADAFLLLVIVVATTTRRMPRSDKRGIHAQKEHDTLTTRGACS
jgi:hypothetical protein